MFLNEHYDDRFGSLLSFLWRLRDWIILHIEGLRSSNRSKLKTIATPQYYGLIRFNIKH